MNNIVSQNAILSIQIRSDVMHVNCRKFSRLCGMLLMLYISIVGSLFVIKNAQILVDHNIQFKG